VPEIIFFFLLKDGFSSKVECATLNAKEFVDIGHKEDRRSDEGSLDGLKGLFLFVEPLLERILLNDLVEQDKQLSIAVNKLLIKFRKSSKCLHFNNILWHEQSVMAQVLGLSHKRH
jgi:hypothetical protein